MQSLHRTRRTKSHSQYRTTGRKMRRLPIPLRYIVLMGLLVMGFAYAVPKLSSSEVQDPIDRIAQTSYIAPAQELNPVLSGTGEVTNVEMPDWMPKIDIIEALTPEPELELASLFNNLEPAAGLPLDMDGVFLPEARPATVSKDVDNTPDVIELFDQIKAAGALPASTKIKSGDILADALVKRLSVSGTDAYDVTQSLRPVLDPRDLKPGHEITAYTADIGGALRLMALQVKTDQLTTVVATRGSNAHFDVVKTVEPTTIQTVAVRGTIDNSLYLSAESLDVPVAIIVELIRIYSWSIDFQRDIRSGDTFTIFYETHVTKDGQVVPNRGNILYADMGLGDKPYPMYRYETVDERVDFFEPNGRSIRKALMKTPIDGARLSSGFGMRKHPVLGYRKAHKGLDFAAPRGTPIYAAGDGVIEKLGWFSSYGKYIRIRHRNGLHTAYAHLNGYKKGLSAGSRVKQGQVIAYVGTTGRSTGPHLHYEVHVNGVKVNPKTVKLPTGEALKGEDLKRFKRVVERTDAAFNTAIQGSRRILASQ